MPAGDIVSVTNDLLVEVGMLGKWLQALGILVIFWIVIQIANFIINRKKMKEIEKAREDLKRIEEKIDRIKKK